MSQQEGRRRPWLPQRDALAGASLGIAVLVAFCTEVRAARVAFISVASGFARITDVASAGDGRLFVVEQAGLIRIVEDGAVRPVPFLDLRAKVGSAGLEQGLLGLAFHPQYATNGFLFVNYTDRTGDTVVARFRVDSDPNLVQPSSERVILTQDQPFANHNGGDLAFGPRDGLLYVALGDGGSGCDPTDYAQNRRSRLGKILRIDVDQELPFTVPPDNPFVGDAGALPEIWALGLRNPWRIAFDRQPPHDLFIADVGQALWEEVSVQAGESTGGENYGWDCFEGRHPGTCPSSARCPPPGHIFPVHEYNHVAGCSITGGFVYRGRSFPAFTGEYFFADFCSQRLWSLATDDGSFALTSYADPVPGGPRTFGEGADGELYVATSDTVYRLVDPDQPPPAEGPCPARPGFCDEPGRAVLLLRDAAPVGPSAADRLVFRFLEGPPEDPSAFGDPTGETDIHLCIYTDGVSEPILEVTAPAGGTCGDSPCWTRLGARGFRFLDPALAQDGLARVVLRAEPGGPGSRVVLRGDGADLPLPELPLESGIGVQVRVYNSTTDACWGADFAPGDVLRSDAVVFRAERVAGG